MSNSASIDGYLHIEGYNNLPRDIFDKRKIRAGMRKAGRLVMQRAQMNLALARGEEGYPVNRTGQPWSRSLSRCRDQAFWSR